MQQHRELACRMSLFDEGAVLRKLRADLAELEGRLLKAIFA